VNNYAGIHLYVARMQLNAYRQIEMIGASSWHFLIGVPTNWNLKSQIAD
jgi:hypothetical protein